jgi:hypothetical protein
MRQKSESTGPPNDRPSPAVKISISDREEVHQEIFERNLNFLAYVDITQASDIIENKKPAHIRTKAINIMMNIARANG